MNKIRIGTRASPLAMIQAKTVQLEIAKHFPDLETEICSIHTGGDWKLCDGEKKLSEAEGGKGQFAKLIEGDLLSGKIDIAVHSTKDMDSFLPDGLVINHMLPREDPRDALLFRDRSLSDIPDNAVVGTASVRRAAMLRASRDDLSMITVRGNVQTRIAKLRSRTPWHEGSFHVTLLAIAGLKRLGLDHEVDRILSVEEMLPAAGQGAVCIEMREGDDEIARVLDSIACVETFQCVSAERAALKVLDGTCHTPIGAYALFEGDEIYLRVQVYAQDGSEMFEDEGRGTDPLALGVRVGEAIKVRLPDGFLA